VRTTPAQECAIRADSTIGKTDADSSAKSMPASSSRENDGHEPSTISAPQGAGRRPCKPDHLPASADIGIGVGPGSRGRQLRCASPKGALGGANSCWPALHRHRPISTWYVKAELPPASRAVTEHHRQRTPSRIRPGGSSFQQHRGAVQGINLGVKAKAGGDRSPPAANPDRSVMSGPGRHRAGARFPMGLKEVEDGKVRIICPPAAILLSHRQADRAGGDRQRAATVASRPAKDAACCASPKPTGKAVDWNVFRSRRDQRYGPEGDESGRIRAAIDPEKSIP